jgi:hypothetical protein
MEELNKDVLSIIVSFLDLPSRLVLASCSKGLAQKMQSLSWFSEWRELQQERGKTGKKRRTTDSYELILNILFVGHRFSGKTSIIRCLAETKYPKEPIPFDTDPTVRIMIYLRPINFVLMEGRAIDDTYNLKGLSNWIKADLIVCCFDPNRPELLPEMDRTLKLAQYLTMRQAPVMFCKVNIGDADVTNSSPNQLDEMLYREGEFREYMKEFRGSGKSKGEDFWVHRYSNLFRVGMFEALYAAHFSEEQAAKAERKKCLIA